MSLTEYRRKRRFEKTREPEPGALAGTAERAIFVVQLHHASRRHYDFRLQVGDALKSWAVPKGPSYDPKVKRMAVEVEDHPLSYAGFEGDIPRGEYGGGHVAQFDHGVWATAGDPEDQLTKGHLRFELFGQKLKGGWHLVRSGKPARQPQWLLFKDDDAYASTLEADDLLADVAAPPAADAKRAGTGKALKKKRTTVTAHGQRGRRHSWASAALKLTGARKATVDDEAFDPQLARLGETPPEGSQWLHEIKWDGYRILVTVKDGAVRLWSRNALEWTSRIPDIGAAVAQLGLRSALLDGELIAGRGGTQDFNLLQGTLAGDKPGVLALVLFDLLHLDGVDVSAAPLLERKALLQQLLADPPPHLAYSSHSAGDGAAAYALASTNGFEGIISKRGDRPYRAGRGDDWRKTKRLASQDYAVVGYTAPRGSRNGFGSLLLASPDPEHGWRYAGRVGSGFSDAQIKALAERIGDGGSKRASVFVPEHDTDLRSATWFQPRFVVEVASRGVGGHGLLRQPSLKAIRMDKNVADLADPDAHPPSSTPPRRRVIRTAGSPRRRHMSTTPPPATTGRQPPALTSPTKVLFPDNGKTKRDVWDYYQRMVDWLLPEIAGRPLSIIRCPAGTAQPCFFQKHHSAGLELVSLERLDGDAGNDAPALVVQDAAALLELVQFNTIEFHPWGAPAADPDHADRIVFDLDPGPGVAWSAVVDAARQIRSLLLQLKLTSFVRTSGGKGLHVVVPLSPGCNWSVVKPFAHAFADSLAQLEPLKFVATASKRVRRGRIFVDYLRNGRGATSVASFSLRARPGAPVAMPLRWEELGRIDSGAQFDIDSAPLRMRRLKSHPWNGIDAIRQDLEEVGLQLKTRGKA